MSKKASKKQDTISQLKKEESKLKKEPKEEDQKEHSDEEEDQKNKNEIKEQTVQKADKPKNLKELFGSMGDTKPKQKPKPKKEKDKQNKYEEPGKYNFTNSKGTANADKIDKEARNRNNLEKKTYKNAQGLDAAAKENQKIKPTKNYLEKDSKKKYKDEVEDVAKPQFKSNKEGDENFVELNKNEDVRNFFFIFYYYYVFSYWLKIWPAKIMKLKMNILRIKKEGQKKEKIKRKFIKKKKEKFQEKKKN